MLYFSFLHGYSICPLLIAVIVDIEFLSKIHCDFECLFKVSTKSTKVRTGHIKEVLRNAYKDRVYSFVTGQLLCFFVCKVAARNMERRAVSLRLLSYLR